MRKSTRIARFAAVVLPALLISTQSGAQSQSLLSAEALAAQIEALKRDYEGRLQALESQLSALKARSDRADARPAAPAASASLQAIRLAARPPACVAVAGRTALLYYYRTVIIFLIAAPMPYRTGRSA